MELPSYLIAVTPWWMLYSHGLTREGRNFCGENTKKSCRNGLKKLCCFAALLFSLLLWLRADGRSAEQAVTGNVVCPSELIA